MKGRNQRSFAKLRMTGARHLLSQRQPIREPLRQTRGDNLILRRVNVVFDAAQFHELSFGMEKTIRGVPVSVARLADAADIDEVLLPLLDLQLVERLAFDL